MMMDYLVRRPDNMLCYSRLARGVSSDGYVGPITWYEYQTRETYYGTDPIYGFDMYRVKIGQSDLPSTPCLPTIHLRHLTNGSWDYRSSDYDSWNIIN